MKYIVCVSLKARDAYDCGIDGEYSGIEHDTRDKAKEELKQALFNNDIYTAWIEEVER